jgi:hypothetical protein
MPTYVPDNFDIGVAAPIDSRSVKATTVERDAIPTGVRFDGLAVYVVQDSITYQLQGGTTNNDWVEIAGGSVGAEYLYNLLDVEITNPANEDELSYNNITSKWENRQPYFVYSSGSDIKTRADITNVLSKANVVLDGSKLRMYRVSGGTDNYVDLLYSGTDLLFDTDTYGPIFKLTDTKQLALGGTNIDPDAKITLDGSSDPTAFGWVTSIQGDAAGVLSGLKIGAGGDPTQTQLIIQNADGSDVTLSSSYANTGVYSRDLVLGTSIKGIDGVDHRDLTAIYDNYVFNISDDNSTTGFSIRRDVAGEVLLAQMNSSGINIYAENGIILGGTTIQGDLNMVASINAFQGSGTGVITALDKIKTLNYFEGDSIFNHNTLVLPDSSGPNKTKIAEVLVDADEYVTIELDYTIPNSPAGMNKGRVLVQVGYNPTGEITQTVEVPVTVAVDTGYNVDNAPSVGQIGILNTNGGASPPFNNGEKIRIPIFSANEMTVTLLSTGTHYVYSISEHPTQDFTTYIGEDIFQDQTTLQEITETIPGDSFITSLTDVKDRSTGETGVTWLAVLNDVGTPKSLQLFANMTIDDTFLSYIAKYQKEGDADVTFYDEQTWTDTLPAGTDTIYAQISTGDSYWSASGNNLYNINSGNVGIDEDDPLYKLHVNGDIGLKQSITFKPSSVANETTISAPTELATALKINSSAVVKDLVNISEVGNVFINTNDNASDEGKLNVTADSNSVYAIKAHSKDDTSAAARFSGGKFNELDLALEITDYYGQYSVSMTGGGRIDANQEILINYGVIMSCNNNQFKYKGDNVWTDGQAGSLGDLSDVDLAGLVSDSYIKWDGNNWIVTPVTSGITNLGYVAAPTNGTVTSDTGTYATLTLADVTNAGLMSPSHWGKLEGIAAGANVNVQVDWNEASGISDAYIQNKPTALSDFSDDLGIVTHIADPIIHVTQTDKNNWNAAEANVQADWNESNTGLDSFIQNKPALTSAATTPVTTSVTELSGDLITSGGVYSEVQGLIIDPSTGFARIGDNTLRLTQGSTIINITDVPKLDTDGKVLASQTRTLAGGATHVFTTTAALEASVQGGADIPVGDFIYITTGGDTHNGMWIAAVLLTGVAWDMATAVAAFDVLKVSTSGDYYTQTEINTAFANNEIVAGDGLSGGDSLAYAGATVTLTVDTGNGLKINSTTKAVEIDTIIGTPTGIVYTP